MQSMNEIWKNDGKIEIIFFQITDAEDAKENMGHIFLPMIVNEDENFMAPIPTEEECYK